MTLFFFLISLLIMLHHTAQYRYILSAVMLLSLVLISVGYGQYFTYVFRQQDMQLMYKVIGLWTHKNVFTGMVFLTLPFLFYALTDNSRLYRSIAGVSLGASLILLFLLQTRSLWIAIFIFALTIGVLYYLRRKLMTKEERKGLRLVFRRTASILLLAVALAAGITSWSVGHPANEAAMESTSESQRIQSLDERAASIFDTKTQTRQSRLSIWRYTLDLVRDHPFLGVGPGNWKIRVTEYYEPGFMDTWYHNYRRPHNDFLLILAERGLPGLLLFSGFLLSLLLITLDLLKRSIPARDKLLAMAMLGGVAGFCVDASLSFPYERVDMMMMLMLFSGVLLDIRLRSKSEASGKIQSPGYRLFFAVGALLLIMAAVLSRKMIEGEKATKIAYAASNENKWGVAVEQIDKVYGRLNQIDPSNNPLLWYRGRAHSNLGNHSKARADLEEALRQHPGNIAVLTELGILFGNLKDFDQAESYLQRALDIYPNHSTARMNLGIVYYFREDYERALEHLYACLRDKEDAYLNMVIREAESKRWAEERQEDISPDQRP
jgi:O-antigen ligase